MSSLVLEITYMALGVLLLAKGADLFIDSSVAAAKRIGVSQHVIGITLVAFATSLPELAVSSVASWQGNGGMAIGNVIGSNVANITLALGLTALFFPILSSRRSFTDSLIMIGVTLLFWGFLFTGGLVDRIEGLILVILYIVFMIYIWKRSDGDEDIVETELAESTGPKERPAVVYVLISLLLGGVVVLGARLLVTGAAGMASRVGISDLVVGSTIVAVGTSLPEIAASLSAGLKNKHGIALGNILGSNIMNILIVLGVAATISPVFINQDPVVRANILWITLPLLVVLSLAMIPLSRRKSIGKWAGVPLLIGYVVFLYSLWISI